MTRVIRPGRDLSPPYANRLFRGFTPDSDGPQEVRMPKVELSVDRSEYLRNLRQMLKQMPPQAAYDLIEFHHGLTHFEAIQLAKETGKLIVPNTVLGNILAKTKLPVPSVWSGTMLIYDPIGHDAQLSFRSIAFKTPNRFNGPKRHCGLVVEHPDFELVSIGSDSNYTDKYELLVQDESRLNLLSNLFRGRDGVYGTDAEFGLPTDPRSVEGKYTVDVTSPIFGYIGLVKRCENFLVRDHRVYLRFDEITGRFAVGLVGQ